MQGPYNAASPAYVTQLDVVRGLAKAMNKKGIRFPVPSLMLRVVLGEMANMILFGSRLSV
ncbi:MAG: hypothetical protein A2V64_10625 [Bacteroidetes bacterium RBG_13_43_22]|nr:MAG: hypothetical protein A2V64_10625 [Bacteroidetes bacterium RBG_13_43_22]